MTGERCERGKRKSRKTGQCEPYFAKKLKNISKKNSQQPKPNMSDFPYGDKKAFKQKVLDLKTALTIQLLDLKRNYDNASKTDRKTLKQYGENLYEQSLSDDDPEYLELLKCICNRTVNHDRLNDAYSYIELKHIQWILLGATSVKELVANYPEINDKRRVVLDNFSSEY
jgi:hypothetical protein